MKNKNVFLSHSYLSVLHKERSEHFVFRYVIIYNRKNPIGVVYFQINDFPASLFGELIKSKLPIENKSLYFSKIYSTITKMKPLFVTCGNNFISGEFTVLY